MSVHQGLGNSGRAIIPSARRGIHSPDPRVLANENMVRYGDESSDDERPPQVQEDIDEVDNVLSKLSHTSTPVSMRRRNSLTPLNLQYTDDSEEHNALAKSLPATFPSRSNYSDEFGTWRVEDGQSSRLLHKSQSLSPRSRGNRSADSRNSSFASRSPSVSHRINQSTRARESKEKSSGVIIIKYLLGLLTLLSATYYYNFLSFTLLGPQDRYDEVRFHRDLNELGEKYKVDDDSILQLQAGISTIFKKEDTSCVIFLYNSQKNDFDPRKFDGFVNDVVSNAAKFLRNNTTPSEHRVVDGAELSMGSHTQLVREYQEDIAKAGVLLVRDVARVPSPLAMAFHYYCDEFQPLVRKSAIFFTLNTAKCHNADEKSSHASVERCLKEKWNTVPKDNIGPLLTRVVSIVVDVTSG